MHASARTRLAVPPIRIPGTAASTIDARLWPTRRPSTGSLITRWLGNDDSLIAIAAAAMPSSRDRLAVGFPTFSA